MRLEADWLTAPHTQGVLRMLARAGHQAWTVGGCVRNALLDRPVADIDIATDAHPEQVMRLARAAGLKPVPTGVDHGTVTVISGGQPYEVTTFRADIETDGRRAVVRYSDDIATDAARRDFTMNALYADAEGEISDPLGEGLDDLRAHRVRFIGDPAERIEEDALRILRFFRFSTWYGRGPLDAAGLAAVRAGRDRLARLSRERIGAEMARLLEAPDPSAVVAAMAEAEILDAVLPGAHAGRLPALIAAERAVDEPPAWLRRLAALGDADWTDALRLSRAQARHLSQLRRARADDLPDHEAAYRFGPRVASDAALLRAAAAGTSPPAGWREAIAQGAKAAFPLGGADLGDVVPPGPRMGDLLQRLEAAWIDSRFSLPREALLARAAREAQSGERDLP